MKFNLTFLLFITGSVIYGQSVDYKLSMPKPQNHYFHVEMELKDFNEKEIDISLPVWAPGSYLVREFSKNINLVKAFDENGQRLFTAGHTAELKNEVRDTDLQALMLAVIEDKGEEVDPKK